MASVELAELCNIVRTKNAGPFVFTLDIVFKDGGVYQAVKTHKLLTRELIAAVYGVAVESVTVFENLDNINAFKASIRRHGIAASPGDSDVYAMNQEVPALTIRFPLEKLPASAREGKQRT